MRSNTYKSFATSVLLPCAGGLGTRAGMAPGTRGVISLMGRFGSGRSLGGTSSEGATAMSYKILVVEDHPVLLASTMALFQSEGEHQVDGARYGAEALARLSKESFDLVVSDLRMPGVDGVQLIQRLPMQRQSPAVAIV